MSAQAATLQEVPEVPSALAPELVPATDTSNQSRYLSTKELVRRGLIAGAAVVLLTTAAWYGWDYWTVGRFLVSTDDAYVKADNTTIAPKVSGYLNQVLVRDNQQVKAGQVLARIDDRDFKVALDQAVADVAAANAAVDSKRAQLDVQQAVISAAMATLNVDMATRNFTAQEKQRYAALAATGSGSVRNAQDAEARDNTVLATIERDKANLISAQKRIELLNAELAQAAAATARAKATQHQAELNLSYTTVTAPIDGVVGNRTLRVGQFVQAGTQLMALVPSNGAYVIANFKETQLGQVRAGQPVEIEVDMFPGKAVRGHVDSLAPASGQEFALLPPDNATGNFTKIVQRIPVKIVLDSGNTDLRPGMSVVPSIQTNAIAGEALPRAERQPAAAPSQVASIR